LLPASGSLHPPRRNGTKIAQNITPPSSNQSSPTIRHTRDEAHTQSSRGESLLKTKESSKKQSSSSIPLESLANANFRSNLPMRYFCSSSKRLYGELTPAGEAAAAHEIMETQIKRLRRAREKDRASRLANALTDAECHRIRREMDFREMELRALEDLQLAGGTLILDTSRTPNSVAKTNPDQKLHQIPKGNDEATMKLLPDDDDDDEDETEGNLLAPRVRVVDGEIIIDHSATVSRSSISNKGSMSRHVVEEAAAGRYFNQGSFTKKTNRRSARWRPDELVVFYQGLKAWGLNFEAISRMIPGKTRINIKNKYHSELKRDRGRIDAALTCGPSRAGTPESNFSEAGPIQNDGCSLAAYSEATGIPVSSFLRPLEPELAELSNRIARGETLDDVNLTSSLPTDYHRSEIGDGDEEILALSDEEVDMTNVEMSSTGVAITDVQEQHKESSQDEVDEDNEILQEDDED
jgi:hypothetical protein